MDDEMARAAADGPAQDDETARTGTAGPATADDEREQARRHARAERDRAAAVLDLQEGRGPVPLLDDAGIATLLRSTHRIAVVGASSRPSRPSCRVFEYLLGAGYDCVPVNPNEREVLGVRAYPDLPSAVAATGPFDLVDVFRRSEACTPIAEQAVATGARALWLQIGVVNWDAARVAASGGLAVVMDRCTAIEDRRIRR